MQNPGLEHQLVQATQGIERHLDRIATVLEAQDQRALAEHHAEVHLDSYPPEVAELIARLLIPGVTVRPRDEPG